MENPTEKTPAGPLCSGDLLDALREYIDARIEEALASIEEGADKYRMSCHRERDIREAAWKKVLSSNSPNKRNSLPH